MATENQEQQQNWDHEVDLVVVGSGCGGLTAALTGAGNGLDTLVVEKAAVYGGTTALSGGNIWVPNNPTLRRAGIVDSRESVRAYLDAVIGDRVPSENIDKLIDAGPQMLEFLESSSKHMVFQYCTGYSDYHPEKPGGRPDGRTIEPLPFNLKKLKGDEKTQRPGALATPAGLYITSKEFVKLNMVMRTWAGRRAALATGLRAAKAILLRQHMETLGQALVGRLRLALKEAGVPLWLSSPMQEIITDAGGNAVGIRVSRDGKDVRIHARKGVILAAGGFEGDAAMRKQYLREGGQDVFTAGSLDNTGDAIVAGEKVGGSVDLMDDAWWMPAFQRPNGVMHVLVSERSVPPSIIVDGTGNRFTNESSPYVTFVHAQLAGQHDPVWMIFDGKAKSRYQIGGVMPGQKFPGSWFKSGLMHSADSIGALAAKIGLPADQLEATVTRFNGFAKAGHDDDFGRGESAYDNYYGDPTLPQPTLDTLEKAPYFAVRLRAGDLGTKGGLQYNADAQVLRADGSVINGLYAVGNSSAAVMGNDYAGAGATIGPAMVFGFVAARHAAGKSES
jgi:3-oxosteroid 1-dehydrogenase